MDVPADTAARTPSSPTKTPTKRTPNASKTARESSTSEKRTTDAEEVNILKGMFGSGSKAHGRSTTSEASSASTANRPKWHSSPLRNPPGALRGVRPVTNEPWMEVAEVDMKSALNYGHEHEYEPRQEYNYFVEEARRRREENASAASWDSSVVRHAPAVLRGQKARRAEPWSKYHNDSIDELNSVDDTSINELYAITADRGSPKNPTITQPDWDGSTAFGKPSKKALAQRNPAHAAEVALRAEQFRQQRRRGAPGTVTRKAKTER